MFQAFSQWRLRTWFIAIILLTTAVYGGTLKNEFVNFDDPPLITDNAAVHELSTRTLHYVFTTFDPELYIPLTLVSYQLDWVFFHQTPAGVHFTNLLLHLINVLLVGWVVFGLTRRQWTSVIVAGLFALHPLNAQAVLWASARKDLLSTLFCLASFGAYLRYRRDVWAVAYFWSVMLFLCALLSKVSVAPLPLILILTDWVEGDRFRDRWKEKIPFFILSVILVIVGIIGKAQLLESSDVRTNLLLGLKSIAFYLWKLFVPVGFSIIHPQEPLVTAPILYFALSAAVTAALLITALLAFRRWRLLTWGVGFFLLLVIPSFTNFFQNGELYFAYERYAYLPLIGILIILVQGVDTLLQRHARLRIPVTALGLILLLILATVSWRQVPFWRNSETLFRHVLVLYPHSAVAHANLGVAIGQQGRSDESLNEYQAAYESDPEFVMALFNTSLVLRQKGRYALSDQFLQAAMQVVLKKRVVVIPDLLPFFTFAELQKSIGNADEALRALETAVHLAPKIAVAHFNLGVLYHKYNRLDDALRELEIARSLQPRNAEMQYHLASIYAERGRLKEAEDALLWVLWLNPAYPNAQEHLQNIRALLAK